MMFIETTIRAHHNVMAIDKAEYDLLREKAAMFNQVCDIYRKKVRKEFKYDWDYAAALDNLLLEYVKADMPAIEEAEGDNE